MKTFLHVINIIFGIVIVILILIQGKGAGLGSAWGGGAELFQTRRGIEKFTMTLTIIFIVGFFIVSLINLFF